MMEEEEKERPVFKLSRCARKPAKKRPASKKSAATVKPPKRARRNKRNIPIPSFSPVTKMEELDASILDTPEKPKPIVWNDTDDDDDDDLLTAGPTFGPVKSAAKVNTTVKTKSVVNDNDDDDDHKSRSPRQVSSEEREDAKESSKSSSNENLPLMRKVDDLLQTVDLSKVTLRDICNMTLSEHDDKDNKALRRLIRQYVKNRMANDDDNDEQLVDDTSPQSLADTTSEQQHEVQAEVKSRTNDNETEQLPGDPQLESSNADNVASEHGTGGPSRESSNAENAPQKTVPSRKATCKPETNALTLSVDSLFVQADPHKATMKDFFVSLQAEYGAKLHKDSRAFVKARLKALFNGEVEPSVSLPDTNVPQDTADTEALLDEATNQTQSKAQADTAEASAKDVEAVQSKTIPVVKVSHKSEASLDETALEDSKDSDETHSKVMEMEASDKPERKRAPQAAPPVQVAHPAKPKARTRSRRRKAATKDQTLDETENHVATGTRDSQAQQQAEKPAPKPKRNPPKRRAKKGTCALCTTCTCTIGRDKNTQETPVSSLTGMSKTDAEIERALIRRAKHLEGIVDKYENMLDRVKRELKKHRRAILKKQEAQLNDGKQFAFGDSRFLPDADVWDEQAEAVRQDALPKSLVDKAQGTLFAYHGNHQPTLTQMFGNSKKEKEDTVGDGHGVIDVDEEVHDAEEGVAVELCSPVVMDEESDAMLNGEEAMEGYGDVDDAESIPEDSVHRLSWRKGSQVESKSSALQGSGVWSALTTNGLGTSIQKTGGSSLMSQNEFLPSPSRSLNGLPGMTSNDDNKYMCAWDALFSDHLTKEDGGMTQLLNLFETEVMDDEDDALCAEEVVKELSSQESTGDAPMLTQRGASLAEAIENKISSDPVRMQAIEAVCPNWRDNIRYALAQRGEEEIREALDRVRGSMKKLATMKEAIPALWKRQEVVLQLFEMSLSESLNRLKSTPSKVDCGEITSKAENSPLPRQLEMRDTTLYTISEGDENSDGMN